MIKNKTFIIAEIGINHDGFLSKAKKLIDLAKKGGADAVKFQYFLPEDLYLKNDKNFSAAKKFSLNGSHNLLIFSLLRTSAKLQHVNY